LGGHSNIASSWYAQAQKFLKLQNKNVLSNRLALLKLPGGVNCLLVEIFREFLNAGHLFFENPVQAKLLGILTPLKGKNPKKYNKSRFT